MPEQKAKDEDLLFSGVLKINSRIMGLVLGILFALIIFIMTIWLVIKGGPVNEKGVRVVGPHLALLGQFFIGYTVSFFGAAVGAVYAFAIGTICGSFIGWVYNRVVHLRSK
ncbi:MAG: hypothetical protein V3T30_08435 [Thermodesulfobacteriota bacterium]